ncbi:MAG: RHS repeat protein [Chloroflexota bacterium]|nr:RHS repeat protein [Chloroflexota bacterium]MDQ5867748.1 RHS repeat protein [Chloroflexota bacterium]
MPVTDAQKHINTYVYDGNNRLHGRQGGGNLVQYMYNYDAVGNLVSIIDADGHITNYTYDHRKSDGGVALMR